jgi:hypothetical protein
VSLYKLKTVRMVFREHEQKLVMKDPKRESFLVYFIVFSEMIILLFSDTVFLSKNENYFNVLL